MLKSYLFGAAHIKARMVWYLAGLLVVAAWGVGDWSLFLWGLVIIIVYSFADIAWTFLRDRKWYFPMSSLISALIIALVLGSQSPSFVIVIVPLLAVLSKQFIRLGFHRHIFNPAAFGLLTASFVSSSWSSVIVASWWGVSWNTTLLPLLLAVSALFILLSIKRWHVALSFLATHTLLALGTFLWAGMGFADLLLRVRPLLWDGTTLFFVSVMLVEPITSQFPRRMHGILYGTFAAAAIWVLGRGFFGSFDIFLAGLVAANLFASLLFLRRRS